MYSFFTFRFKIKIRLCTLDPRITNISFDNFTGSICIITPITGDDDMKELMVSSSQTHVDDDLFTPNDHLALITQPILGARSRKKDKIDSKINSHRSLYNDSPSLILPINQMKKFPYENKTNHHESSDSGLDLSFSTNSSTQYFQQQYTTRDQPLSALNEDSNIDDTFYDQPIQYSFVNLERNRSEENIINQSIYEQEHRSNLFSDKQNKMSKNYDDSFHFDTLKEFHQQTNINKIECINPSSQQYQSLNDLTNKSLRTTKTIIQQTTIPTLKKLTNERKLNIIVKSSTPLSTSFIPFNDEQIHSTSKTSNNQTIFHSNRLINQQIKPKATISLSQYPNQEQIREHINRSVIERQHRSYLSIPQRKDIIQQTILLNASPSKLNNHLFRKEKQSTTNSSIERNYLNSSTIQNFHIASSQQTKQTLPYLYNEEIIDDYQKKINKKEKKRSNNINQWQRNYQKNQIQVNVKGIGNPLKINQNHENSLNQIENFLTSTPCRHYEHVSDHKNNRQRLVANNFSSHQTNNKIKHDESNSRILKGKKLSDISRQQQQQQLTESTYQSIPVGLVMEQKNRTINRNNEFESEYSSRNTTPPFHSRPTQVIRISNIHYQAEQKQQFSPRQNSPTEYMNYLLETTRIQPTNINDIQRKSEINRFNNTSKMNSIEFNKTQQNSNRLFEARSPTSWLILSDDQINQQQCDLYKSSSSSSSFSPGHELIDHQLTRTHRLIVTDEQRPLHERYVMPNDKSQHPSFIDHSLESRSCQAYPFTNASDSGSIINAVVTTLSNELTESDNMIDQQNSSFSSLDHLSPNDELSLPLENVTMSMKKDDILINYDSDDGWSDDSAELIYVDDRYITENKKTNASSSSSHLISKQYSSLQPQQNNVFRQ
ncbi:unnamed protein product [Rotaria sp. Silwood2]|nr:unnamed protein product [Rotaria sp. Silwood2]